MVFARMGRHFTRTHCWSGLRRATYLLLKHHYKTSSYPGCHLFVKRLLLPVRPCRSPLRTDVKAVAEPHENEIERRTKQMTEKVPKSERKGDVRRVRIVPER
jgi:hypothetical protein